jgi:hypothetical protein
MTRVFAAMHGPEHSQQAVKGQKHHSKDQNPINQG